MHLKLKWQILLVIYFSTSKSSNSSFYNNDNDYYCQFSVSNTNVRPKWNDLPVSKERSLGILEPNNEIRQFCGNLVSHQWFEYIIIILIVISCVLLAVDEPAALPETKQVIAQLDFYLTVLFIGEMLLKIIATSSNHNQVGL